MLETNSKYVVRSNVGRIRTITAVFLLFSIACLLDSLPPNPLKTLKLLSYHYRRQKTIEKCVVQYYPISTPSLLLDSLCLSIKQLLAVRAFQESLDYDSLPAVIRIEPFPGKTIRSQLASAGIKKRSISQSRAGLHSYFLTLIFRLSQELFSSSPRLSA